MMVSRNQVSVKKPKSGFTFNITYAKHVFPVNFQLLVNKMLIPEKEWRRNYQLLNSKILLFKWAIFRQVFHNVTVIFSFLALILPGYFSYSAG